MKIVVRTVIAILIALVSAIAAHSPALGAAAAPPGIEFVHGFICDDDPDSTSPIHSTRDRGPPSQDHRTQFADDHGCRGTATRTDSRSGYCGIAHGALALTARANDSTSTTRRHVHVFDGVFSAVTRAGVAANTGHTAARTCLRSFGGHTLVLMADGTKKPIEDIEVGDKVVVTDPETGESVTRKVTRVWVHYDQVLDLVVDGEVITTTEDHLFWSVTDQKFERADLLAAGEVVFGDDGRQIVVSGFRLGTERTAVAYNLSIAGVHTYHVGRDAILVHNDCQPNLADLPAAARTTSNEQFIFNRLSGPNHKIPRDVLSDRLHDIKSEFGLGGADNVVFDMTGNVWDPRTGDYLGMLTR